MNYSVFSLKTRRKYLKKIVRQYRDTKVIPSKKATIEAFSSIWPCSHSPRVLIVGNNFLKCPIPGIKKKLGSDVEFLMQHLQVFLTGMLMKSSLVKKLS